MIFDKLEGWQDKFSLYFAAPYVLGPLDLKPLQDRTLSAFLTDFENVSVQALTTHVSVILGRRGAGKSSILKAFEAVEEIRRYAVLARSEATTKLFSADETTDLNRIYTSTISIVMHSDLSSIQTSCLRIGFAKIEHYVEAWRFRIWHYIVRNLASNQRELERLPSNIQTAVRNYKSKSEAMFLEERLDAISILHQISTLDGRAEFSALSDAMVKRKLKFLILGDNVDEYDVRDDTLFKAVAGLVRVTAEPGPLSAVTVFKIALPFEIYDLVAPHVGEDKTHITKQYLRWSPGELLRIGAFRFLCYLKTHHNGEFAKAHANYKGLDARELAFRLMDDVLGTMIQNEANHPERAFVFLLRHTQLLPRQVLLQLSQIVGTMHSATGNKTDMSTLRNSILSAGDAIADHILDVHKFRYPEIRAITEQVVSKMDKHVVTARELHSEVFNECPQRKRMTFKEFADDLLRVGIIGVVDNDEYNMPDQRVYVQARFCYANPTFPAWVEDEHSFALHPIFAHRFPRYRAFDGGVILPKGTLETIN